MAVKPAELRYQLALSRIFRGLHGAVSGVLEGEQALRTGGMHAVDAELAVERAVASYVAQLPDKVAGQFHTMAARVVRDTKPIVTGIRDRARGGRGHG